MAFMVSKSETSLSDSEKANIKHSEEQDTITRQLCLRPSSTQNSSEALDKQVVLKRIRHHKCLNKVKSTFQALAGSSEQAKRVFTHQQKWVDPDDAFSSP